MQLTGNVRTTFETDCRGRAELQVRFTVRATRGGSDDRTTLLELDIAPGPGTITATDALDVLCAALH